MLSCSAVISEGLKSDSAVNPDSVEWIEINCGRCILCSAVNNLSIAMLFLRRINEAVTLLENMIQQNPGANLTDAVVFNLCTMYDLSCAHEQSAQKKKMLQSIAAIYRVTDVNWKSFRL